MADQLQFDRLRRTCSAKLKQFITEAHETERQMQYIRLPVGVQEARQFLTRRQAEYNACHEYLLASSRLADFLRQKSQSIQ